MEKEVFVLSESEFNLTIELDLQPLGDPAETRIGKAVPRRSTSKGPFDRHITVGRCISITSLEGLDSVHSLCVIASPYVMRLTTQFFPNAPTVRVRRTRAGRLELDFTKALRQMLIDALLDPVDDKSVPIDVYVIKRGRHIELECVRRGKGRPM